MLHQTNFYWLDLMRGLAAQLVFLSHIRVLYFLDFQGGNQSIGSILLYFVSGFGHSSVIIFFVLSGFFIIRSIDRTVDSGKWSVTSYFVDRLSRLWVVLIPALLFTLGMDEIGTTLFPESPAYQGKIYSLREINPSTSTSLGIFLGNIFFLQTILIPSFGSNTPLWSLANEFWYYLIFPIMYFAVINKEKYSLRAIYLLIAALLLFFVGRKIANYYVIWLMGGVSYFLYKKKCWEILGQFSFLFLSLILLLGTLACIRLGVSPTLFNNYTLGITTSLLILTLLHYNMPSTLMQKIATFLSDISYTLYLVHMPLSIFLTSLIIQQRQELESSTLLIFCILYVCVIGFSYIFWLIFEKQTSRIKGWVKSRLLVVNPRIL